MSRHGYSEDYGCDDPWELIRYRGAVTAAIRGKRGQALLRRLRAALDAMPDKRLVSGVLVNEQGACCALGAVAKAEGLDVAGLNPEDVDQVALTFGVAPSLVREITYENDEAIYGWHRDEEERVRHEEHRWRTVSAWVDRHLEDEQ